MNDTKVKNYYQTQEKILLSVGINSHFMLKFLFIAAYFHYYYLDKTAERYLMKMNEEKLSNIFSQIPSNKSGIFFNDFLI